MWPVLSVSNGFVRPAFTMQRRDMWSMNPKKELKMVDNKRLSLLITKAKSRDFGHFFYHKGTEKMVEKDKKLQAKNRDFLDFTSGALPPVDDGYHFDDYNLLSASKTLAEELAASSSFAEAAYIYPSSTSALDAALTHARNMQSSTNSKIHLQPPTIDYISLSNNIPPASGQPADIGDGEVEKLISQGKVSVVFVEPIHGYGGIQSLTPPYLQSLRIACDKSGVLLAFDEVKYGMGQTGELWANHLCLCVKPDLMIVEFRGVIGIGALLVNKKMKAHIHENDAHMIHGCGEALNVLRKVAQRPYLDVTRRNGRYLKQILYEQLGFGLTNTRIRRMRVFGLVAAMEFVDVDAQLFVDECKKRGLGIEIVGKGNKCIRIMPPFSVTLHQLHDAVCIIKECLDAS